MPQNPTPGVGGTIDTAFKDDRHSSAAPGIENAVRDGGYPLNNV